MIEPSNKPNLAQAIFKGASILGRNIVKNTTTVNMKAKIICRLLGPQKYDHKTASPSALVINHPNLLLEGNMISGFIKGSKTLNVFILVQSAFKVT